MRGLDRNLSMLFALNLAVSLSSQLIQPLFPLYLESLGASEVENGLVIALASVAATVLMLPSGVLIDRLGKKRMLLIGVALAAFPPVFISVIEDWRMVVPFAMVFSSSFSFFVPARMAMIAESATPENRATLFGLMNIAWPVGGIVSPVLGGYVVEKFGWGSSFLAAAAINAVSLIPTMLLKEKKTTGGEALEERESYTFFDRRYLSTMVLFFMLHLFITTGMGGVSMILPLSLKARFQLSYHLIGLFFTGSSLLMLLTQIPSGVLADRYGRKRLIVACIAVIPVLYGVWPFIENWVALLVLHSVAVGLWSMTWPATLALLSDSVPPEMLGTAFGVRMTGVRLGFTIGPILAASLYSTHGSGAPFIAAALFYFLGIPLSLLLKDNHRKAKGEGSTQVDKGHPTGEPSPPVDST
ncbi:MAG: MFS transporter [Candidatus Bathyarchaeia archaeon]